MIPDAVRARLKSSPFRPFTLRLGSGEHYEVRHPELVSLSPGGRHLILWTGDNSYVDVDSLLIESIEQANGRGRRRRAG